MKSLTLEKAFNIAFFEKDVFENFINFNPSEQVRQGYYEGRVVYEPSLKLKEYLKFIREYILSYLCINEEVVFSYRKGSSTYDAVKVHSLNKIFYNTDIKNFFPSINEYFARSIILRNIANIPIIDIDKYIDILISYIIYNDSLPVGFSTSPSFSNACLFDFDNKLHNYCKENGYLYSRYSDDIIISSGNKEGFSDVSAVVADFLKDIKGINLVLNEEKSKLIRKGNKVKLLGMVILPSGKVSVDINTKKRVEHLIHFYITDKNKFIDAVDNDAKIKTNHLTVEQKKERGIAVVSGLLNHINTIDKMYLDKLKRKYGNVIIDMFFHKNVP